MNLEGGEDMNKGLQFYFFAVSCLIKDFGSGFYAGY